MYGGAEFYLRFQYQNLYHRRERIFDKKLLLQGHKVIFECLLIGVSFFMHTGNGASTGVVHVFE